MQEIFVKPVIAAEFRVESCQKVSALAERDHRLGGTSVGCAVWQQ